MFESAGIPDAFAGAQVLPAGYGPGIDDYRWEANAVYHDIGPDAGWITTVEAKGAF